MTREEAHKALQDVEDAMHALHDDSRGRLSQLRFHLIAARDAISHMFDHAENTAAEAAAAKKG